MIIRTHQDYLLVDCGCCSPTVCDAPRLSCESITINPCGFQLPALSAIPDEDLCKKFAVYNYTHYSDTQQTANPMGGGVYADASIENTHTLVSRVHYDALSCTTRLEDTEDISYSDYKQYSTGDPTIHWELEQHSTSSPSSPCNGTETYTDHIDPDNNYTDEFDYCNLGVYVDADNSFSYTPYNLVYTETNPVDAYTTESLTITHSYTDLIDAAWLSTKMSTMSFDDANGDYCSSSLVYGVSGCPTPTQATLARYRVGIPESFALSGSNRTVYECQWQEIFVPSLTSNPPVLVNDRSWVWDGNKSNPYSGFYTIPLPTSEGETVVANMLVICYRSTRLGVKPTAHGEIIEL